MNFALRSGRNSSPFAQNNKRRMMKKLRRRFQTPKYVARARGFAAKTPPSDSFGATILLLTQTSYRLLSVFLYPSRADSIGVPEILTKRLPYLV